ncbi:hypothetical protein [Agaribacter marinus]|uniref:Secreted protein n=1 Tax=Agaribacter marinus TaxID=1431249 RepID=A0AA37WKE4_9ALTE|nr:hypothetical protein [Agaribacter marinus]GLR70790.1 hypothetical protein GCM10007852_16980 [Agaribacter marinus]
MTNHKSNLRCIKHCLNCLILGFAAITSLSHASQECTDFKTGPTGDTTVRFTECKDPPPGGGTFPGSNGDAPTPRPTPPLPPPPPVNPPPPPKPEQPKPKTERQICLEKNQTAKQNRTECRATGSSTHTNNLKNDCLKGGQISIQAGSEFITVGVTFDQYTACKDIEDSKLQNAYDSCDVIFERAIKICPQ